MTTRPRRRRALAGAAVLTVVAGLLLAGCSGADTSQSGTTGQDAGGGAGVVADPGVEQPGAPEEQSRDSADGEATAANGAVDTPLQGRDVISTVDLVVEVDDVAKASTRAATIAAQFEGYVQSESTGVTSPPIPLQPDPYTGEVAPSVGGADQAIVVLRVPTERAQDAVDALEALGETVSRTRSSEDVTEQVIDVRTRIATQRAAIDRLEQLLDEATDVTDVLAIENELTTRVAELESLEARQQQLSNLTSLATITTTFALPQTVVEEGTGFVAGLEAGWRAFVRALELGLTAAGALLPFVVFGALLLVPFVVWLVVRQRRARARRAAAAPSPLPPTDEREPVEPTASV